MRSHKKTSAVAAVCLTLTLGACAGDPDRGPEAQAVADTVNVVFHHAKWKQVPATPENHVEKIIFEQRVAFDGASSILDRDAVEAINRFLAEAKPNPNSLINLSVAGNQRGTATLDRLTLQRLEAVRIALSDHGYMAALATDETGRVAALGDGEVGITVARVMAVLPDCDLPQPLEPDAPRYTDAFGCSSAYNLGTMVANPEDLERGRPLEPADAEAAVLAIQRYQVGEPKPLLEEDTKSQ